jgi:hypothetical protein
MEMLKSIVLKKNKKSQSWGMDIAIASVIFSFGIILLYVYSMNNPNEAKENIESLSYEAESISNIILSEGYPKNWQTLPNADIIRIGILNNNSKIDQDKLDKFYSLTQTDYEKTKVLFSTRYDYAFCLPLLPSGTSVMNISTAGGWIHEECIGGKNRVADITATSTRNLFKVTRFTIYENKPVTADIYVWELNLMGD